MARLSVPRQLEVYDLKRSIEQLVPHLADRAGPELVQYFASRLDDLVDRDVPERLRGTTIDLSTMWRSDIRAVQLGHEYDPKSILVDGILSAANTYAEAGGEMDQVLSALRPLQKSIFRRLELHLVAAYGSSEHKRQWVMRPDLFGLASARTEYRSLLEIACGDLTGDELTTIGTWIDSGDQDRFGETFARSMDREPSPEDSRRHRNMWRLGWLTSIRTCLTDSQRTELAELEALLPAPAEIESQRRLLGLGRQEPVDLSEMASLSGIGLLAYAASAAATGKPSADVVSRELIRIASSNPDSFQEPTARNLDGLDPTFAHAIALGLRQATQQGRAAPWSFTLDLTRYVLSSPAIGTRVGDIFDYEADWTSATVEIGSLLAASISGDLVPADAADEVWDVLIELAGNANPTPEYEKQYGPPNMGPLTLALNTVRPAALTAVIEFAKWRQRLASSMTMEPRVAKLLAEHLGSDPSIGVRAVYGERFVTLLRLDRDWVTANLAVIFGDDMPNSDLGRVAWEAFLFSTQPHPELFAFLERYYAQAVAHWGGDDSDESSSSSRLAYHIAAYYVWGVVGLDGASLVSTLVENAPPHARAHFVSTFGEWLRANSTLPDDVKDRLVGFWEWFAARAVGDRAGDLAEFGWWFGPDVLDPEWCLEQLVAVLRRHPRIKNEVQVAERLQRLAPTYPELVLDALEMMAFQDERGWVIYSIEPVIRGAIQEARKQGARGRANQLVSKLLANGFIQYGDLAESG